MFLVSGLPLIVSIFVFGGLVCYCRKQRMDPRAGGIALPATSHGMGGVLGLGVMGNPIYDGGRTYDNSPGAFAAGGAGYNVDGTLQYYRR